jgi:hypothetical protein
VVYVGELLEAFGVAASPAEVRELVEKRFVKYIWERAGLAYSSVDYDAQFETVLLDLNYDDVPPEHRNAYDLVMNCGTTEHVLNQMNSFRIIHDLTRVGGYMFHDLPWSGMFSHGLVNYKPTLFWRLCQSNGYTWVRMQLRAEVHDPLPLPENILAACDDTDREIYRRFAAPDGSIRVVLRKAFDIPFVCPLDMEETMILPDGTARNRYWTLAEPAAFEKVEAYRRRGFPNDEPTPSELRESNASLTALAEQRRREAEKGQREAQAQRREAEAARGRLRELEDKLRWMEGSRFWKLRNVLSRWKKAVLPRGRSKAA